MSNIENGDLERASKGRPEFLAKAFRVDTGKEKYEAAQVPAKAPSPKPSLMEEAAKLSGLIGTEKDPGKRDALLIKLVQTLNKEAYRRFDGNNPKGKYQMEFQNYIHGLREKYGEKWREPTLVRALTLDPRGYVIGVSGKALDFPNPFSAIGFLESLLKEEQPALND